MNISVKKRLGNFTLNAQFQHNNGILGVLGASGCGKSMLLKCIAGVEKPDSGHISWNQKVFYDSKKKINVKSQRRKVGFLFQNYALFPKMSVIENMEIAMKCSKDSRNEKIKKQIELFHLQGLEERFPSQLSGGQQQRVALARMFLYEPEMILLDEPFSALDYYLKEKLEQELKEVLTSYQGQVIIVSHNREELYYLCNELAVMQEGKIILKGQTKSIFSKPLKVQAARLTGCKNISAVKRMSTRELFALDWGIRLCTEET